jgi:hypothetical protein
LALASLVLAVARAGVASAEPHLARASGDVQIGRGEPAVWAAGREGAELGAGDAVRTGSNGRAEVDLGTAVVRLYENSLLRLPVDAARPDGPAAVGLEGGTSLFDVGPRRAKDPFEVRTPEVVASVKGTRFGVAIGARGGAAVSVFEGLVGVHRMSGGDTREVMVYPGFAATGSGGRPFELSLLPAGDVWRGWSEGEPPLPAPAALDAPSAASQSIEEARAAAQNEAARELGPIADAGGTARAHAGGNGATEVGKDGAPKTSPEPLTSVDRAVAIDSPSARPIQEQVVGALLNGVAPSVAGSPAAGSNLGPLSAQLKGEDTILVSGSQGLLGQITEKQLETVIETGNPSSLPPQIVSALNANGVNPVTFAKQLSTLLH